MDVRVADLAAAGYYAVFFADPSGNRLEIYVRPPEG
jgi:catechol-2,3-dioxygenase